MLDQYFSSQITLGLAQAGAAIVLALIVMLIAARQAIHLEREIVVALVRGLVQVVAVGSILVLLLQGPDFTSLFILAGMIVVAASIASRRSKGLPGAFRVSLYGIGVGSAVVILPMTWIGVIDPALTSLVPVGSMLIANAMNANALAFDRFKGELQAHAGQVEAGLSLGGAPARIVLPYARAAVQASLIPQINSLRSLGIVWIPGLMTGMILAGADPIYAAIYQFVVIAMIFAAAGITSLVSTLLIRTNAFSEAEQLLVRAGGQAAGG
jgi:putative ABC transport system permease protein